MANKIQIGNNSIRIDTFDWQDYEGKKIRCSGVRINGQMPEKYVNGYWKRHWIYTFFYEDNTFIEFKIDYDDKYYK